MTPGETRGHPLASQSLRNGCALFQNLGRDLARSKPRKDGVRIALSLELLLPAGPWFRKVRAAEDIGTRTIIEAVVVLEIEVVC